MSADYTDILPYNRHANWICKYCSDGFYNLASLEFHLKHSECRDAHFVDRGKAAWRRYEDGVPQEDFENALQTGHEDPIP